MVKIYKQPFAHDGDAIAIPDVSQPDGKMSSADGWTVDYQLPKTDPNYKSVGRQEMNGVFKEVTEALGQVQVQGSATWSAEGAPYPVNAQVYHNGKQWIALRANSVEPADGEDWSAWGDSLRQDLANPVKGALMVRGAVIYVNTIADLQAMDTSVLVEGQQAKVRGDGFYIYQDGEWQQEVRKVKEWRETHIGELDADLLGGSLPFSAANQGIAYLNKDGEERLFVSHKVAGSKYKSDERQIIVEYSYTDNGGMLTPLTWTQELNIGHGQGLTAEYQNGQVVLWTHTPTEAGLDGYGDAGKGVSKILWKGSDTEQSDITSYQLFGYQASDHPNKRFFAATPSLSTDGRHFVICAATFDNDTSNRWVIVYDRDEVEGAADPLEVHPISVFPIANSGAHTETTIQGCVADETRIYTLSGQGYPFTSNLISVMDYRGSHLDTIYINGARSLYSREELFDGAMGVPGMFEPEGMTIKDGEILFGQYDWWREPADIVDYEGYRYAARSNSTNNPPTDPYYWTRTTKASNAGEWSATSSYQRASGFTIRKVHIFSLHEKGRYPSETLTDSGGIVHKPSGIVSSTIPTVSYYEGGQFSVSKFDVQTGKYRENLYLSNGQLTLSNPTIPVGPKFALTMQNGWVELRSDRIAANGAGVNYYTTAQAGRDSHGLVEYTGGRRSRELDSAGKQTNILNDSGYVQTYQRTLGQDVGGVHLTTLTHRLVALNGASFAICLTEGDSSGVSPSITWTVHRSDKSFRPGEDNIYTLGSASNRVSEVFAATGSINTSDQREKEQQRSLSDAETRVALALKSSIKAYKWKDSVDKKGAGARWHVGVMAQEVESLFAAEGLDAHGYGMFCYDEWDEQSDDEGGVGIEAGNRYGVRYDQVIAFIISAI